MEAHEPAGAEVARILDAIPVRASRQMTVTEYQFRVAEVLRLFDIEAVGDETGVYYGAEGLELEDQPLDDAISAYRLRDDSASRNYWQFELAARLAARDPEPSAVVD